MQNKILLAPALLAALLTTAGCGDDNGLIPASGTVTIDGQPLTVGQVMVSPEGARQAIGVLDDQGRFSLSCYKPGDGVPRGAHPVAVMAVEQINARELKWHTPRRYSSEVESRLVVTIDGPTDDLKIELTWEGSPHKEPFIERF